MLNKLSPEIHHIGMYYYGTTRCPQNPIHFCFLNSFMKHWPILVIFGMQHTDKRLHKWM